MSTYVVHLTCQLSKYVEIEAASEEEAEARAEHLDQTLPLVEYDIEDTDYTVRLTTKKRGVRLVPYRPEEE